MLNSIKKLFLKENSIRGASLILIITLALSNILGVLRDHFLAQKIPTDRLDIYYAAFRFPDLVFNVLIIGAIAAAFVPVYSKLRMDKGNKIADKMASNAITIGFLAILVALVILYFLMPVLMKSLVGGFSPDKLSQTITAARILLISPMFFTVSYFFGGVLNSHKRFLAYSLAPLVYNLAIILSVLIFADKYDINGIIIGVIFGAVLHMLVQLPSIISIGFKFQPIVDLKDQDVIKIARRMIPRAIGLGANQILLLGFTGLAAPFAGAIAIYNLADNIQTVPSVIFGNSFATAAFPTLASLNIDDEKDSKQFHDVFIKSLRAILFFLIPSTAFLIVLRAQIVRLILGYGFFGWSDTKLATGTLGLFAISIVAQGLIPLFARTFYALHNTITPMITSIISIFVSIILGFLLSKGYIGGFEGVRGLALAFSVGSWLNLIMLVVMLKKIKFKIIDLSYYLFAIMAFTFIALLLLQLGKMVISDLYDIDRVRFLLLQTIVASGVGILSYLGLAWIFKIREIK